MLLEQQLKSLAPGELYYLQKDQYIPPHFILAIFSCPLCTTRVPSLMHTTLGLAHAGLIFETFMCRWLQRFSFTELGALIIQTR